MKFIHRKMAVVWLLAAILLVNTLGGNTLGVFKASAEETGSITVQLSQHEQSETVKIYRIFDLESYNKTNNTYSYVLNAKWTAFANEATAYFTTEVVGNKTYVKWVEGSDVKAFAKLAMAYAEQHEDTVTADGTYTGTEDHTFTGLPLGYYLVDTNLGAVCNLTTTNPDVTVKEKNELSTVEKKVKEDSTGDYGEENDAQIGQTVEFKSEIKVGYGCENLILHDSMDEGLTLDPTSIKVYVEDTEVSADNYTIVTDVAAMQDTKADWSCTFEVVFNNEYTHSLTTGTILQVKYNAVLNRQARISTDSNNNRTYLEYGDHFYTNTNTTKTYTYTFDMIKVDENGIILDGAEFLLYDAENGGNVIPMVELEADTDRGVYVYRVADQNDLGQITANGDTIRGGFATIIGLDSDVYYLEETKQPAGYNRLGERVEVDMTNGNLKADTVSTTFFGENNQDKVIGKDASDLGGVQIINVAGTILPSTGGMGTTLLYGFGLAVVATGIIVWLLSRGKESGKTTEK